VVVDRCTRVRRGGEEVALDVSGRQQLLDRAHHFAERGLRVLMVAEGDATSAPDDPQNLVALGFLGIRDPLKPAVRQAIEQCREAGIRAIMLTGDHPETARAIAQEAGLLDGGGEVITATEIAELDADQVADRLDRATVIARATPLDKLRIIESLQRHGHVVAMTGDGANDGPALRLADVGVAMGRGTEVARQAADVVLIDDDFSTLVEALIEGRVFWRNIRRALGLLLGGNLGELGILVVPSLLGLQNPLNTRQILAVNMLTDVLPALSIALQKPEHRRLDQLAREGTAALERPLRLDIFRRGLSTAIPSLTAYLLALRGQGPQASGVAFASLVADQLAQTLDLGLSEGRPGRALIWSVISSAGVQAAAFLVPPAPALLGLASPPLGGWLLVAGSAVAAVLLSRLFDAWANRAAGGGAGTPAPALAPVGI
jgi:magnesium-transporting ATPase (P-type)